MKAQREIPVEEEDDTPPVCEYEINDLELLLAKKARIYLSKTDSRGRGGGGGSAIRCYNESMKINKLTNNNICMI